MTWKEIWERKGMGAQARGDLHELISLDGFDTGAGKISQAEWERMVWSVRQRLRVDSSQNLCEIGCGAGAFLYPMYQTGVHRVFGVDYAASLVAISAALMPEGVFIVAEASNIPFKSDAFDAVASNSVFQYFPNHAYAASAFLEMIRVMRPGGRGVVLDINDASKKEAVEAMRRAKMPAGEYERLYRDLPHLFYEKEWWLRLGDRLGVTLHLYDQDIAGYGNSPFRYNAFFEKPAGR